MRSPTAAPADPQGPEFVAVDTRNAVAAEAEASPNGKALMLGVIHLDGHFYEAVVDARPKARLTEWFAQLAWVLHHYRPTG
ncbi:hypothetical protein [Streptomyces griseosporeus]|uniref:hypothetical protein n=1 Tax=Streptomyces griseosporeus TaxID=1910 RepID=UPI0036FE26DA